MTAIKSSADEGNLPFASSSPVLTITQDTSGEIYHLYVRHSDGHLVLGSRSNFVVLSQRNASDLQASFDAFASTGTFT